MVKLISKLFLIFLLFQSLFADTKEKKDDLKLLIDTKKILKDLDIKIEYYEGILIEKEKKFAYLEKDKTTDSINTLISLNREIEDIKNQIYSLKLQKNAKEYLLKSIINSLKFVNSSNISDDYKKALKLFGEGKSDEADNILDVTKLNSDKIKIANQNKELSNRWLLKANIFIYNQKIDQVKYAFKQSLSTIETFSNTFSYAIFLETHNKLAKAEKYYNKAKNLQNSKYEYATVLNNLGSLYVKTNRYSKAERYYIASLKTFKQLIKLNRVLYLPELAILFNNIGNLYYQNNKLDKAKDMYNQVLDIFEELNNKNGVGEYDAEIAMVLNNMGNLYHKLNSIDNAKKAYKKSLKIREDLSKKDPVHNVELAMVLNNIGSLYYNLSFNKEAEEAFVKAYHIRKKLAQANPEAYEVELAMGANNLGNLYNKMGEPKEAEKFHLEALLIYEKYARVNPEAYNYHKGVALNNLAQVYEKLNEKKRAEEYYQKVIKIREELVEKNFEAYGIDLARTKLSYGFCIGGDQGEILINEAITSLKKYPNVHNALKLIEVGEGMLKRLSIR